MSITYIPEQIKMLYYGAKPQGDANTMVVISHFGMNSLTKFEFNSAYIAHIIADKPKGPRGDPVLSSKLKRDLSNLMLLCDVHHRLIDHQQVEEHSIEQLQTMKAKHEQRIELLTSLTENKKSHVLIYGANIGNHTSPVGWNKVIPALLPYWMPAEKNALELSLINSSFKDREPNYWKIERENLERLFETKVRPG